MRKGSTFDFIHSNWLNANDQSQRISKNENISVINALKSINQMADNNENISEQNKELKNENCDEISKPVPVIRNGETNNCAKNFFLSINLNEMTSLPSYGYDVSQVRNNSDMSDRASYTDLKLENFHSRLKAETEEIRQWQLDTSENPKQLMQAQKQDLEDDSNNDQITEQVSTISKLDDIKESQFMNNNHLIKSFSDTEDKISDLFGGTFDHIKSSMISIPNATFGNKYPQKESEIESSNSNSCSTYNSTTNLNSGEPRIRSSNKSVQLQHQVAATSSLIVTSVPSGSTTSTTTIDETAMPLQSNQNVMNNNVSAVVNTSSMTTHRKPDSDTYICQLEQHIRQLQPQLLRRNKTCNASTTTNNLGMSMNKDLEHLQLEIHNRDITIKQLNNEINEKVLEKEKTTKENVRLKEQQIELKNQMTHLLTYATTTKREFGMKNKLITEFCEEQDKLNKITKNLQSIIVENKTIFTNLSGELCARNDKLSETIEHVKFMENKLNDREIEHRNLRSQLESVSSKLIQSQNFMRNIQSEYNSKNEETLSEKIQITDELNACKNENKSLREQIEILNNEIKMIESKKQSLREKVEQIQQRFEDLHKRQNTSVDQYTLLSRQLSEKDHEISELTAQLADSRQQCEQLVADNNTSRTELDAIKSTHDAAEQQLQLKHNQQLQEISKLKDRINEMLADHKKAMRNSEKTIAEQSKEICKLESQINELKHQKTEMVEYLYKLPTSSLKWSNFFQ